MQTVRKQLIIPADMDRKLAEIAEDSGTTSSEVVRRALTLYMLAVERRSQGMRLGFASKGAPLETEVVGI